MKQTLNTSQVADALRRDEYAKWSYEACHALAEYYENYEEETGEEIELDVVAIRCDWSEYATHRDVAEHYGLDEIRIQTSDSDEEVAEKVEAWIEYNTQKIDLPNGKGLLVRDI